VTTEVKQNERTAMAQTVTNQPDGPGKRIGKRGELTLIGQVAPGGAALFRERLPQFQAAAGWWEDRVGTVADFRLLLFDNDTRILFTLTFDGDFKPYLVDLATKASEWLDGIFVGVVEGYKGLHDPGVAEFIVSLVHTAEFFYVSNSDVSVRDVQKMKRLSQAVSDLLDAAN
jgi:hypothetical protein